LRRAGRRLNSFALEADSRHLMTDVWTSIGVLGGLGVVALSGWLWLDAVVAIAVGIHILVEGYRLVRASADGMMDRALDAESIEKISGVLKEFERREVRYKDLKTRRAGTEAFIQLSVLVPRDWTVGRAHEMLDEIEARLSAEIAGAAVVTHLEPIP
jgi:cation diffusion facilitator family transporter